MPGHENVLERAPVRVEDYFLRLTLVGHDQETPAVAQLDMGYLDGLHLSADVDGFLAEVELESFTRSKHQRNEDGVPPARSRSRI